MLKAKGKITKGYTTIKGSIMPDVYCHEFREYEPVILGWTLKKSSDGRLDHHCIEKGGMNAGRT